MYIYICIYICIYIHIYIYIYIYIYNRFPLKTVERLKLVGKIDFLLTSLPVLIVQTIYIYIYDGKSVLYGIHH